VTSRSICVGNLRTHRRHTIMCLIDQTRSVKFQICTAVAHSPLLGFSCTVYYRITQFYLAKALACIMSISSDFLFTKLWVVMGTFAKNMLLFVLWLWAYQLLFYFCRLLICMYSLGDSTVLPNCCYIYFHKVLKICSYTCILAFYGCDCCVVFRICFIFMLK